MSERTENVYEGPPDARQTENQDLATQDLLFRKRYRQLDEAELKLHDQIKDKADELALLIGQISRHSDVSRPPGFDDDAFFLWLAGGNRGANVTLAIRHLEDCVFRAVKALTT